MENNKVTHLYVKEDVNSYADVDDLELVDVQDSLAYEKATKIMAKAVKKHGMNGELMPTFNSYHNLETW